MEKCLHCFLFTKAACKIMECMHFLYFYVYLNWTLYLDDENGNGLAECPSGPQPTASPQEPISTIITLRTIRGMPSAHTGPFHRGARIVSNSKKNDKMEMGNKITQLAKCTIKHAKWALGLSGPDSVSRAKKSNLKQCWQMNAGAFSSHISDWNLTFQIMRRS